MKANPCKHPRRERLPGPRIQNKGWSTATEKCGACGRIRAPGFGRWEISPPSPENEGGGGTNNEGTAGGGRKET